MKVIDLVLHGDFNEVIVFQNATKIESMSKNKAALCIGDLIVRDYYIQIDSLGLLCLCIYL